MKRGIASGHFGLGEPKPEEKFGLAPGAQPSLCWWWKETKKKEGTDDDDKWFEFTPTRVEGLAGEVASLQAEVEDLKESVRLLKDSVRFEKDKAEELFVLMTKGYRRFSMSLGYNSFISTWLDAFSPQLAKDIEQNIYNMANRVGQQPNKYLVPWFLRIISAYSAATESSSVMTPFSTCSRK